MAKIEQVGGTIKNAVVAGPLTVAAVITVEGNLVVV